MRSRLAGALGALVVAGVSSCGAPDADIKTPELEHPASLGSEASGPSAGSLSFRNYFADEHLQGLIAIALEANPDLHIALQRIEMARAGVRQRTGAQLPQVNAGVGVGVSKPGRYTTEGAGNASTDLAPGQRTPTPVPNLAVGLESTWELDAWGKLRNLRESAVAQYLASVAGAQLVKTELVTQIAAGYFELVALDHTREVLKRTVSRQEEAVAVVRLQKEAGRANELAVQQFEAQLASTQALEAGLEVRVAETESRLNLLMGRYPRAVSRDPTALESDVPREVSAGVPSELLRNRPDIREAEQLLRSAKCDLQAARAAFFPSIQISAGVGLEAFNPKYLLTVPESVFYSGTVGLVAPLVNRSAIEADFEVAKAQQLAALYNYQKTILNAYVEVANGISSLRTDSRVVELKKEQKASVEQTIEAADVLYKAGKATYVEVLIAQQNLLEAELELIDAQKNQHLTHIRVYKALGGGWR